MKLTAASLALLLALPLASCAAAETAAPGAGGTDSAVPAPAPAPAPSPTKGGTGGTFDPTKPGLQTGCRPGGVCWAVVVDVPWWLR